MSNKISKNSKTHTVALAMHKLLYGVAFLTGGGDDIPEPTAKQARIYIAVGLAATIVLIAGLTTVVVHGW